MRSRAASSRFRSFAPPVLDLTPTPGEAPRPLPAPAPIQAPAPAPPELFIRAIDLPVAALKNARVAVALQLDRLSPLPPGQGVAGVALIGPAEAGLTRFAVAIAPISIFTPAPGARTVRRVWIEGALDGETFQFRFDHPETARDRAETLRDRLAIVATSAACLSLILGGASVGLDRYLTKAQDQLEQVRGAVAAARRQAQNQSAAMRRWTQLGQTSQAGRVGCVLDRLVGGGRERVYLTALSISPELVTAQYGQSLGPDRLSALAAEGVAPSVQAPGPVSAQNAPMAAPGVPGPFETAPGYPMRGPPLPQSAYGQNQTPYGDAFVGPPGVLATPPSEATAMTIARWACP